MSTQVTCSSVTRQESAPTFEIEDLLLLDEMSGSNVSLFGDVNLFSDLDVILKSSEEDHHSSSSISSDPDFNVTEARPDSTTQSRKPSSVPKSDPNSNAKMAKLNREKHRQYVSDLEASVDRLRAEKAVIQQARLSAEEKLANALKEIQSLRATINNQSVISSTLLKLSQGISIAFGQDVAGGEKRRADCDEVPLDSKRRCTEYMTMPVTLNIQLPM
jgi:hypothetical protein